MIIIIIKEYEKLNMETLEWILIWIIIPFIGGFIGAIITIILNNKNK